MVSFTLQLSIFILGIAFTFVIAKLYMYLILPGLVGTDRMYLSSIVDRPAEIDSVIMSSLDQMKLEDFNTQGVSLISLTLNKKSGTVILVNSQGQKKTTSIDGELLNRVKSIIAVKFRENN